MDRHEQHTNLPTNCGLTYGGGRNIRPHSGITRGKRKEEEPKTKTKQVTPRNNNIQHQYRSRINTKRNSRRQARQDKWQQRPVPMEIKNKYRNFQRGVSKFKKRITPSHEDLSRSIQQHGPTVTDNPHYYEPNVGSISNDRLTMAKDQECREMRGMIELLEDGGVGYIPEKKGHGWVRIMFENWNSLGIGTQSWKMDCLNYLIKYLRIDIIAGCESQCDWSMVHGEHQLSALLVPGTATKVMTAHNTTERIQKNQAGGTAIAGIDLQKIRNESVARTDPPTQSVFDT